MAYQALAALTPSRKPLTLSIYERMHAHANTCTQARMYTHTHALRTPARMRIYACEGRFEAMPTTQTGSPFSL